MNLNQDFLKFITKIPKNGCIFICNPNNPTGTVIKKNIMLMIIKEAKIRSTLIFIDECFMELSLSNESIINYINDFDNIFLLRSLTKSFGLAGLRIGYGVGNNQIIEILNRIKIPWNVNIIAHNAISSLFKDHSYLKRSKKLINTELLFLTTSISKLHNFFCYNSSVNFILIKTTFNSNYLQKQLLKKKIFIRNCNNFRGLNNHFFRIAVKKHKENICLIKSLEMIARKH